VAENPLGAIAYEEGRKAVEGQAATLDSLQSRASTLLAAAALVTSFLGGQVLGTPSISGGIVARAKMGPLAWLAVASFVAVTALAVAVLWPRQWKLDMEVTPILDATRGSDIDEKDGQAQLAVYWESNYGFNETQLARVFDLYRYACLALGLEVVLWILNFN
jgi:hypothetical protein